MERHQDAVAGGVDVRLQVPVPECDGGLERGQRVLRPPEVTTPVREGERPRMVEEGVHDVLRAAGIGRRRTCRPRARYIVTLAVKM